LVIGIIFLFVGTGSLVLIRYSPLCSAGAFHDPDEYYFENVNVFIFGRCREIGSDGTWMGGLFIGIQSYPDVLVTDTRFEGIRVKIFNESIFNPWVSLSGLINTDVYMRGAEGIFFYGCWQQYSARLIPSIIFIYCHADKVWIRFF
jgi:hypothetical protein